MRRRYDWPAIRAKAKRRNDQLTQYLRKHRTARLLLAEVLLAVVALIGISMFSVPVALILGGVGGIVAIERQ